jgi:hypothetical protein
MVPEMTKGMFGIVAWEKTPAFKAGVYLLPNAKMPASKPSFKS